MIIHDVIQKTNEWDKLRQWKITWTRLKQVMWSTTVQKNLILELISEVLAPKWDTFENEAMIRWSWMEEEAREYYEKQTWEKVEEIWFCTHDTKSYLGLSPDGFIKTWENYWKAVEIKCMWPKNHIKCILDNKIPAEYKWQVINYFIVNQDLKELDFVIYNPDIYIKKLQFKVINIKREDIQEDINKAEEQLEKFIQKWQENINLLTK